MDFVRVFNTVLEVVRVFDVLDFKPPPPKPTFRSLEPLYESAIQHYQEKCEKKYQEITSPKSAEDGETADEQDLRFQELDGLLEKHCMKPIRFESPKADYRIGRLIKNLEIMLNYPHLKARKHSDYKLDDSDPDLRLGPERYVEKPYKGYGFSNDYLRQWMAAIPGPLGQHFEREESSSINFTRKFQQLILAFAAGASLLVPMIIMTFQTSRTARLIVVSVATILFGMCFALASNSKENILGGTAAYAAVMVVYIGTASPSFENPS